MFRIIQKRSSPDGNMSIDIQRDVRAGHIRIDIGNDTGAASITLNAGQCQLLQTAIEVALNEAGLSFDVNPYINPQMAMAEG